MVAQVLDELAKEVVEPALVDGHGRLLSLGRPGASARARRASQSCQVPLLS
jgi:hypothetical protein